MRFKGRLDVSSTPLTFRRTKIVATVGPASTSPEVLEKLILAGVNVFRMNFSHGTSESHRETFSALKAAIAKSGKPVGILGDLCGPKIRVGHFENGPIQLVEGKTITLTVRKVKGNDHLVPSEYTELNKDVKPGDKILLADGTRELKVLSINDTEIECLVVRGGELSDRKGINLPGVNISTPSFTEKDRADATLACELGVDFLALSFVRSPKDVLELKAFLAEHGKNIPIVSKIEKPEALECIEEIIEVSDAIMVARGDLGVEMPAEEIPLIQKELTHICILRNKPVIVATQMLESMITAGTPTRAEVTDVAWAAMAGADAVMLSGETSVGKYPVEAVATMDRIVRMVEGNQYSKDRFRSLVEHDDHADEEETINLQVAEGLSRSTSNLSRELNANAIAVCALTGETCRMISAERPQAPIFAFSTLPETCNRLSLYWGVLPQLVSTEIVQNPEHHVGNIISKLRRDNNKKNNIPNVLSQFIILVTLRDYDQALSPSIKVILGSID